MQTEQIIAQVNQATPGNEVETARKATIATIKGICAHMSGEQQRRFTSQLPRELSEVAEDNAGHEVGDGHVDLTSFYDHIAGEADLSRDEVANYVRAVTETLQKAVTDGELVDVTFDLPPELNQLFVS